MLQNLSKEIRECLRRAEECRRLANAALTESAKADYLAMERRWPSLAHSYEFAERLSAFTEEVRRRNKMAAEMRERFKERKLASITHLSERK